MIISSAFPQIGGPVGSFILSLLLWLLIAVAGYYALTYVARHIIRRIAIAGSIDDELLSIVRRPLLVLCILFGVSNSVPALALPLDIDVLVQRILYTALVIVATRALYRILVNVVLHHAEERAAKTETRLDDVLVAMARLLMPVIVVLTAGLLIFAKWGVDVGAALAGLGIIGLVIGLALQETLTNIVAGISILADEPFTPGELIVMPANKVCRVEHIGLRTTRLYDVEGHATVYVPNKDLANAAITNIIKPSYDMRTTLDVGVAYASNLNAVIAILEDVMREHPNVLVSDMQQHIADVEHAIARQKTAFADSSLPSSARRTVAERIAKWEAALPRLHAESALNNDLHALDDRLGTLAEALRTTVQSLDPKVEIESLRTGQLSAVRADVEATLAAMEAWVAIDDPWALAEESAAERTRWLELNKRLRERWAELDRAVQRPTLESELRLDTATHRLRNWLATQYKAPLEIWKDPNVDVKGFGASSVDLSVQYFLDDVRLEHFERQGRVNAELMIEIHERFKAHNIEIPFPQMDLWMRSERLKIETAATR